MKNKDQPPQTDPAKPSFKSSILSLKRGQINFAKDTNQMKNLFERNLKVSQDEKARSPTEIPPTIHQKEPRKRSASFFKTIFNKTTGESESPDKRHSQTERESQENIDRKQNHIVARIIMAQEKLQDLNIVELLRDRESELNEAKVEMKNLDQELIMNKIETALLKSNLEEALMEEFELTNVYKEEPKQEDLAPKKQDSTGSQTSNFLRSFKSKF